MILQWIIVALIVAACATYLVRTAWRTAHGKTTGCGCEGCPVGKRATSARRQ